LTINNVYNFCVLLVTSFSFTNKYFYYFYIELRLQYLRSLARRLFWSVFYCGRGYRMEHVCICGKDLSLKTRVVTHPGTSNIGWFLILEHVSDWGQSPGLRFNYIKWKYTESFRFRVTKMVRIMLGLTQFLPFLSHTIWKTLLHCI